MMCMIMMMMMMMMMMMIIVAMIVVEESVLDILKGHVLPQIGVALWVVERRGSPETVPHGPRRTHAAPRP